MLHHILDFKCGAFTITGCEQSSTINERLYIIFPGTRHYKLSTGKWKGKLAQVRGEAAREQES